MQRGKTRRTRGHLSRGALLSLLAHIHLVVPLGIAAWIYGARQEAERPEEVDVAFENVKPEELPADLPPLEPLPPDTDQKKQKPKPTPRAPLAKDKKKKEQETKPEPEVVVPPLPSVPPAPPVVPPVPVPLVPPAPVVPPEPVVPPLPWPSACPPTPAPGPPPPITFPVQPETTPSTVKTARLLTQVGAIVCSPVADTITHH